VHLCQTQPGYWAQWEAGCGPGQARTKGQEERRDRVLKARAKQERLINWLIFFRQPEDRGVGDTVERLLECSTDQVDARNALVELQKRCNCKTRDATAWANERWKYCPG